MKIIIKNLQKKIQIRPKEVRSIVLKVLSSEKKKPDIAEITVCFVTDRIIKRLNSRFLGIDLPTDVISFCMRDQSDPKRVVADIAISLDSVKRNVLTFGVTLRQESERMLIHGLLHLAGYDDRKRSEIKRMRQREDKYLRGRGFFVFSTPHPEEQSDEGSLAMNKDTNRVGYVYILTNKNNRVLYTGSSNNLVKRARFHKKTYLSGFTKKYNVYKLIYYEAFADITTARNREREIKGWRREKKIRLIESMNPKWEELYSGLGGDPSALRPQDDPSSL